MSQEQNKIISEQNGAIMLLVVLVGFLVGMHVKDNPNSNLAMIFETFGWIVVAGLSALGAYIAYAILVKFRKEILITAGCAFAIFIAVLVKDDQRASNAPKAVAVQEEVGPWTRFQKQAPVVQDANEEHGPWERFQNQNANHEQQ